MFFKYVQYWIYECFPSVGSAIVVEDYDEKKPRACHSKSGKVLSVSTYHKHLDRLRFDFVCWLFESLYCFHYCRCGFESLYCCCLKHW